MRSLGSLSTVLAVLSWSFLLLSPAIATSWLDSTQRSPSLPFQIPQRTQHASDTRPLVTKLRDGVIQLIWSLPSKGRAQPCISQPSPATSNPPSTMLARYGDDVVLRFRIQTAEEAKALAEASNVLFLDIWEFTTEWVDIRLAKDVVSLLLDSPSNMRAPIDMACRCLHY